MVRLPEDDSVERPKNIEVGSGNGVLWLISGYVKRSMSTMSFRIVLLILGSVYAVLRYNSCYRGCSSQMIYVEAITLVLSERGLHSTDGVMKISIVLQTMI